MTPEKTDQPAEPQLLNDSDIEQVSGGVPNLALITAGFIPAVKRLIEENRVDWAD